MNAPFKLCPGDHGGVLMPATVWLSRKFRCAQCADEIRQKHSRSNMGRTKPTAKKFVQVASATHTDYKPPEFRPLNVDKHCPGYATAEARAMEQSHRSAKYPSKYP